MKKYRQGIRISIVALLAALAAGTLSYALDPEVTEYAVGSGGSSGGGDSEGGTPSGGGGGSSAASKATGSAVTSPAITTLISPDILKAGMPVQIFTDVEAERWSKDAIDFVIQRGIFSGNGDGTFSPSEPLSRGMAAQIFYNLAGRPAAGSKTSFADSDKFLWFEDAISWAAEKGLINGDNGRLLPDEPLTREQMAVVMMRFIQKFAE